MALSIIQYLDSRGVLCSITVDRQLSPEAVERLQEYLQTKGIGTHNLSIGLTQEELQFLQDLGWLDNDLTAEETEFLQERGILNDDLTTEEKDFLRAHNLNEPDSVFCLSSIHAADYLRDHPSDTTETNSRDSSWSMSPSPPSSTPAGSSPPTSIESRVDRLHPGSPISPGPLLLRNGAFGAVGDGRPLPSSRASVSTVSQMPPRYTALLEWEREGLELLEHRQQAWKCF